MNKDQLYNRIMERISNEVKNALNDFDFNHINEGEPAASVHATPLTPAMPTAPYNTPFNTMGVGNPVPPRPHHCGSGDLFRPFFPIYTMNGIYKTTSSKKRKKSKRKSKKSTSKK